MEEKALKSLIKYDNNEISIEDTLNNVLRYDKLLLRNSDGKNLEEKYRRTLEDKPWKICNCDICREIGIHVIIFRGYNRNKQRGFHNIWTAMKNSADNTSI
jgi:hypothetical protein